MIDSRYLGWFAFAVALCFALYLAFTWNIDPYGVSPLRLSSELAYPHKPKRRGIDRYIKPYEVWRDRPRTVFLGSSRILQAINPSLLDDTRFAPAYNAAVAGNSLDHDADQIAQYIERDPNLRVVFVELFFWHLVAPQAEVPPQGFSGFLKNSVALHVSGTTLWDAYVTMRANRLWRPTLAYVDRRGYMIPAADSNTRRGFDAFTHVVTSIHKTFPKTGVRPRAYQAMDKIVELCRDGGIELYFLIMPNHPYDDYRLLSYGYWNFVEQWHRRIAAYPNVLTASQYASPLTEPISERMTFWYDPIHPSAKFGELIVRTIRGDKDADIPQDILLPVNERTVETILSERRSGLDRWISQNRDFVAAFEKAKLAAEKDRPQSAQ